MGPWANAREIDARALQGDAAPPYADQLPIHPRKGFAPYVDLENVAGIRRDSRQNKPHKTEEGDMNDLIATSTAFGIQVAFSGLCGLALYYSLKYSLKAAYYCLPKPKAGLGPTHPIAPPRVAAPAGGA